MEPLISNSGKPVLNISAAIGMNVTLRIPIIAFPRIYSVSCFQPNDASKISLRNLNAGNISYLLSGNRTINVSNVTSDLLNIMNESLGVTNVTNSPPENLSRTTLNTTYKLNPVDNNSISLINATVMDLNESATNMTFTRHEIENESLGVTNATKAPPEDSSRTVLNTTYELHPVVNNSISFSNATVMDLNGTAPNITFLRHKMTNISTGVFNATNASLEPQNRTVVKSLSPLIEVINKTASDYDLVIDIININKNDYGPYICNVTNQVGEATVEFSINRPFIGK